MNGVLTKDQRARSWPTITNTCVSLLCGVIYLQGVALGQSLRPTYEVASVKVFRGTLPQTGGTLTMSGSRLAIHGFRVLGLLLFAFNIKEYQVANRASLEHTMYDVAAIASPTLDPTREGFRAVVRDLMTNRFGLKAHFEPKQMPVYALVVDRGGVRFARSAPDASELVTFETKGRSIGRLMPRVTMADLAERITNTAGLDRPVVDRTGLKGQYTISLLFTPEYRKSYGSDSATEDLDVFRAVKEQLGLRLERRVTDIDVLVIDQITKPTEN